MTFLIFRFSLHFADLIRNVPADGNCMFSAIADQLAFLTGTNEVTPQVIRSELMTYLSRFGIAEVSA